MKINSTRYLSICTLLINTIITIPLLGQDLVLPDELQTALADAASSWSTTNGYDEQHVGTVVGDLYEWLEEQTEIDSISTLIKTLSGSLPVSTNETSLSWAQRLSHTLTTTNDAICASATTWKVSDKELGILRIDYLADDLRQSGYLKCTTPIIVTIEGSQAAFGHIENWKYIDVGSHVMTIHGFVRDERDTNWPDIVVSVGPVGSGSYVYLAQLHFDGQNTWKPVWQTSFAYVSEVDFDEQACVVTVKYSSDKFDETLQEFVTGLRWGGL